MSLLLSSPNLHTYRDATLLKAPKCIWPNNGLKLSNSSVFKRIADFLGISLNLSSTSTQSIMERELLLKGKSSGKSSDLYTLPSNQFDWFSHDCCFVSACFSYCANVCGESKGHQWKCPKVSENLFPLRWRNEHLRGNDALSKPTECHCCHWVGFYEVMLCFKLYKSYRHLIGDLWN